MDDDQDGAEWRDRLPSQLQQVMDTAGFNPPPEGDTRELYNLLLAGKCMACQNDLGKDTVLLIHRNGIGAAYCSGPCCQDIAVLGWIQEQHQDIVDSIEFRGGRGDTAEPA